MRIFSVSLRAQRSNPVFWIAASAFGLLAMTSHASDPRKDSGLPIPRFVSLKSAEINIRSGPGTRYPISWVYHKEGLPVEIIEEFDLWRKIRDQEGTTGWVHKSMLSGDRRVVIQGKEAKVLRSNDSDESNAVLKAAPGVLARLLECEKAWCRVQIDSRKAWIKRKEIWGVYADEEVKK